MFMEHNKLSSAAKNPLCSREPRTSGVMETMSSSSGSSSTSLGVSPGVSSNHTVSAGLGRCRNTPSGSTVRHSNNLETSQLELDSCDRVPTPVCNNWADFLQLGGALSEARDGWGLQRTRKSGRHSAGKSSSSRRE